MRSLALLACAGSLGGCSLVADTGQYTFDLDPCGELVQQCEGGRDYRFVTVETDLAREQPDGRLDGFDLDGTDRTFCGHADFVSPEGFSAIDNQLTGLVVPLEELAGMSFGESARLELLMGEGVPLVEVTNVDDAIHDDCVQVRQRRGYVPSGVGMPQVYLDADSDGFIDPDLVMDYGPITSNDANACIRDGWLYARFASVTAAFPLGTTELSGERIRIRARFAERELTHGVLAGSTTVMTLDQALQEQGIRVTRILQDAADLDPSGNECLSISFGITFRSAPVVHGELRR